MTYTVLTGTMKSLIMLYQIVCFQLVDIFTYNTSCVRIPSQNITKTSVYNITVT